MIMPCFDLIMMHVFMLFPLILTVKGLEISFEDADIKIKMTILILSIISLADIIDSKKSYILEIIFSKHFRESDHYQHSMYSHAVEEITEFFKNLLILSLRCMRIQF